MKKEKTYLLVVGGMLLVILLMMNISAASYELKVTEEHPFYVVSGMSSVVSGATNDERATTDSGKWVSAKELNVGDNLITDNGKKAVITKITDVVLDEPIPVYNLEATPFNDYVMEGNVVVHNSNIIDFQISVLIDKVNLETLSKQELNILDLATRHLEETEFLYFEKKAIIAAHRYGTRRADGSFCLSDIKMKVRILKRAGFDKIKRAKLLSYERNTPCGKVTICGENVVVYSVQRGQNFIPHLRDVNNVFGAGKYPRGMTLQDIQAEIQGMEQGLRDIIYEEYGDGLESILISSNRRIEERRFAAEFLRLLGKDPSQILQAEVLTRTEFEAIRNALVAYDRGPTINKELREILLRYDLVSETTAEGHHLLYNPHYRQFSTTIPKTPSDVKFPELASHDLKNRVIEPVRNEQMREIRNSLGLP